MKNKNYYCSECGSKIIESKIRADKIKVWYQDGMGGTLSRLDSAFDRETGKENIAKVFQCPNRKRWFNNCDKIVEYHNENHYL